MSEQLLPCPFWTDNYISKRLTKCWEWLGSRNNRGYGHTNINGQDKLCHRVSYEFCHGKIPEGMTVDHICRNRLCINPLHLRVMTQKENNAIGYSPTALNLRKTVCKHGHSLAGDHITIQKRPDGTRRRCRLCEKIYRKNSKAKRTKKSKD